MNISFITWASSWENQQSAYAKTKTQISFEADHTFVFATPIVHFLFFLNLKFQASSHLLCMYRPVCVSHVRKPHCWFSHAAAHWHNTLLETAEEEENRITVEISSCPSLHQRNELNWDQSLVSFNWAWREKTGQRCFRPGSTQTGMYSHRRRLGAWNFGFKKKRNCTFRVAKTEALISCAVTAQLICAFVFA